MKKEKWQCSRLNVSPRRARNAVLSQTAGPFTVCPYFKGTSLSLFRLSLEDPNTHPITTQNCTGSWQAVKGLKGWLGRGRGEAEL